MMHGKKQWRRANIRTLLELLKQQRNKKLIQILKEEGYAIDIMETLFILSLDCILLLDNHQISWWLAMYSKSTGKRAVDFIRKETIYYGKDTRRMASVHKRFA